MTSRTRGRLMVCLVLGLITLPAEALLLPIARTPDTAAAAIEWAADLSSDELRAASDDIQAYPVAYRRAIMRALDPADRADTWRRHVRRYLSTHRGLTRAQASVLHDAVDLMQTDAFTPPLAPDVREAITDLYNRALVVLGPKATAELFVTLGPRTLQAANALPLSQQLADRIRSWRVVSADLPDCNCNIEIDTCDISWDPWLQCSEIFSCNFDLDWPMCGPLWSWACTGWCRVIRWPGEN